MAFLAVLREGFETVVFLLAAFNESRPRGSAGVGAVLGIVVAVALGYGIYRGGVRLNLSKFFRATGSCWCWWRPGWWSTPCTPRTRPAGSTVGQGATVDLTAAGAARLGAGVAAHRHARRPAAAGGDRGDRLAGLPRPGRGSTSPGRPASGLRRAHRWPRVLRRRSPPRGRAAPCCSLVRARRARRPAGTTATATRRRRCWPSRRSGERAHHRPRPARRHDRRRPTLTLTPRRDADATPAWPPTRYAGDRPARPPRPAGRRPLTARPSPPLNGGRLPLGLDADDRPRPPARYTARTTVTAWVDPRTGRVVDLRWSSAVTAPASPSPAGLVPRSAQPRTRRCREPPRRRCRGRGRGRATPPAADRRPRATCSARGPALRRWRAAAAAAARRRRPSPPRDGVGARAAAPRPRARHAPVQVRLGSPNSTGGPGDRSSDPARPARLARRSAVAAAAGPALRAGRRRAGRLQLRRRPAATSEPPRRPARGRRSRSRPRTAA